MANTGKITFREMSDADLDEVLHIEFLSYAFPWSKGIFQDCLSVFTELTKVVQEVRGGPV